MILRYTRNKHTSTIDGEDNSILSRSTVEDTFFAATVEIAVKLPDMEITSVKGTIERAFGDECRKAIPFLKKVKGLRIGPGIIKAIEESVGGSEGCPRMADLVWECCNGIILRFTADAVGEILSKEASEQIEGHRELARKNPRLIGSCIAFAEGSPLIEGLEI